MDDIDCPVCKKEVKPKDASVIDQGSIYHLYCYFPKEKVHEQNFVGINLHPFPHDHLPAGSS